MKRLWSPTELQESWTLQMEELDRAPNMDEVSHLGFVAQLAFYRTYAHFPEHRNEFSPAVLLHLARQVGMATVLLRGYEWNGRTGRRQREAILKRLGVRPFDKAAELHLCDWLINEALPREPSDAALDEWLTAWILTAKVQRPGAYLADRLLKSARASYEANVARAILGRLDPETQQKLKALLVEGEDGTTPLSKLRDDPGRSSLETILGEIDKVRLIRSVGLPADILKSAHPELVRRQRRRASVEGAWDLRRHSDEVSLPLLVFYCVPREAELVDSLIDLLLQVTHRMVTRAEGRVHEELVEEMRRVRGKEGILYRIAEAASEQPDGTVRSVIHPVASEETLANLVREFKATGAPYKRKVHSALRSSYGSHYRRMLPRLLEALEFCSNNESHRPLLDAIAILKSRQEDRRQHYSLEDIPIEGVVKPKWRDIVIDDSPTGQKRVNRISYEVCVLESLREQLRCKEVWVKGARRFRNLDEDLPGDFKERRDACYEALKIPLSADVFIDNLKSELMRALGRFNERIPSNPYVSLNPRRKKKPIMLSKLEAQLPPRNLEALKVELGRRWPMTSLLDMLKEVDLRIGFTDAFSTAASRETVDREDVRRRLLLVLYGLGTNAGLKRLGVGNGVSYKELLNTRRLYLDKESLRDATRRVVNATLAVRQADIWGEGTSACASDSKKFAAYDQNLMTEWHVRYGGRGVMVYWHVEDRSVCIYSQLKRCSSSEVASMIEGVLRHETDMEVARQYTDTHGQTAVGFAFCHLLGFSLLPRLKDIAKQKLYYAEPGQAANYPNLSPCLSSKPIDWELIRTQYDEMVRYTTALREHTADAESILRRFTRDNAQHPTYRALLELGKAVKTLFLCDYLDSKALRREIHEGLNVIENWNSAVDFIFFGKGGEVATNRTEDQEASILALHLLQSCLVYINTLMLQRVLEEPSWMRRMTEEDLRGITPLIYGHVSPYGSFELDMNERLDIEMKAAA